MTKGRNIYLKMKSLDEAKDILEKQLFKTVFPHETIPAADAVDRVLAKPVTAQTSSPNCHASAMDGFAVRADETFGASEATPRELILGESAFPVNTGHLLPVGCNAVIMIEHVIMGENNRITIEAPAFPWQYVRKMGEDIVATELLFPRDHRVSPYCLGALIAGGVFQVTVRKKPRVLIIPTGNEIVDWLDSQTLQPGQVFESNSYVLEALCHQNGATVTRHRTIEDDAKKIERVITDSARGEHDIILILGGSSAGSRDYAKTVISSAGTVYVHGVTIMPGKPVLFGKVEETPVFGIPGYPVSAIIAFEQFVAPLIRNFTGQAEIPRETISAAPGRKITSKLGIEEFQRVKIGMVGHRRVVTPLAGGAGAITSITEADGIIRIPTHVEGISNSETVTVELLRPLSEIKNTVVIVGSHDNTLDILADQIRSAGNGISISSSHVGSMGGIMALKKEGCHLAGIHLLDPLDGSYNIPYIEKYLPGRKLALVNLVSREQGLIVQKGNPNQITGIVDLTRKGIRFLNRQPGSGTRILLDYKLQELGIDRKNIDGYENDEYTHMSVAAAVMSGAADAGLGIFAASKALSLDFVPVITERYDLLIDQQHMETPGVRTLLETVRSDTFKERVRALGGYGTEKTGDIIQTFG